MGTHMLPSAGSCWHYNVPYGRSWRLSFISQITFVLFRKRLTGIRSYIPFISQNARALFSRNGTNLTAFSSSLRTDVKKVCYIKVYKTGYLLIFFYDPVRDCRILMNIPFNTTLHRSIVITVRSRGHRLRNRLRHRSGSGLFQ